MTWISVKDRLPEYESPVFIFTADQEMAIATRSGDGRWYGHHQFKNVLYWMPLPSPPEVKDVR